MPFATVNPATGETLATFDTLSDAELDEKLQRAAETFRAYRRTPLDKRAAKMRRAAEILEAEKDTLGALMTREMGKPIRAAVEEAAKCARACRYYADNAARFLADEVIETEATRSFVRCQPLGPILAIMPWNFPFWQVFRFAAPALMAGNVGLLKHAPNVPQCALAIEEIFRRAGFPAGAFQNLFIETNAVAGVLADDRVAAATLTGSERAGGSVASLAGRHIKKTVLEMGGSDPFIVLPGADLDAAARTAARSRTINNGQSCIAAKRFIVHDEVAETFERRFVAAMAALRVGDPADPATDIGPLATAAIRDNLDRQVRDLVGAGARVLLGGALARSPGGKPDAGPGFFYPPTVLADVPRDAPVYREELFGPVALVFRAPDLDAAIGIANDTPFGLAAGVWTNDLAEQARLIDEIEAGAVFVNGMVASDPRLPFGGIKRSGYGRELGADGLREFVNRKTVWIKDTE